MSKQVQMLALSPNRTSARRGAPLGIVRESEGHDFVTTLLAMAGHDLRQPLQVITSAHDVLGATLRDGEQCQELIRAETATTQLATMLNQIVDALQLHEFAQLSANEPVFLGPILQDLALEFCWPAHAKDIRLKIAPSRTTVFSHPVLLRGMLRNLLRNAIEYTLPGGSVVMTCRRSSRGLRINVCDTGVGIRRSVRAQIFTAFARADTARADGLGLGLFIVKRAADLLHHRIEVRSVPGRGSCFTVIADSPDFPTSRSQRNAPKGGRTPREPSLRPSTTAIVTELYPRPKPGPRRMTHTPAERTTEVIDNDRSSKWHEARIVSRVCRHLRADLHRCRISDIARRQPRSAGRVRARAHDHGVRCGAGRF